MKRRIVLIPMTLLSFQLYAQGHGVHVAHLAIEIYKAWNKTSVIVKNAQLKQTAKTNPIYYQQSCHVYPINSIHNDSLILYKKEPLNINFTRHKNNHIWDSTHRRYSNIKKRSNM